MTEGSWGQAVFDRLYGSDPDPWRFDSSPYEAAKYADTLAQLADRRFGRALELGCGNGAMSTRLAERCDTLAAVDISPLALSLAEKRCAGQGVRFHCAVLPDAFGTLPSGPFDLVVISELLYFLCADDVDRLAAEVAGVAGNGALLLLVNWTGPTDTPLTGAAAADRFIGAIDRHGRLDAERFDRTDYRLDRLRLQR